MSARNYHHLEHETWRKRSAQTAEPLTPQQLQDWIAESLGEDGHEAQVSPGVFLEWYSPATDEELAKERAWKAASDERHAAWERAAYERLRAKFGEDAPRV